MLLRKRALFGATTLAGSAAACLFAATPAWAQSGAQPTSPDPAVVQPNADDQEVAGDEDENLVDEVIVTGSRIRRDPTNAPTPLIQLSREAILDSGEANVVDYLADLPALSNSTVPEDTTGGGLGVGGLSLLDLRALGANRTLVLVDGRRHPGAAYFASNSVDVDTIPRLLIQDVEVITGGASAVYGADAVTGVVNFVLRRNFEGLEIDAGLSQINQEGELSGRVSGLVGHNFLDDRLNLYLSAEYEKSEEVVDPNIDWLREGALVIQNDLDPSAAAPDGVADFIAVSGLGTISRPRGGVLTLARTLQPSASSDPDLPVTPCAAAGFSANCFILDPGFSFAFDANGVARPLNFGTFRTPAGAIRTNTIGSPDQRRLVDQGTQSRLPDSEVYRLQTGANFKLTEDVQLFGEVKYVKEETFTQSSAPFFNIGIKPFTATESTAFNSTSVNAFQIGVDNAYLDPAIRNAILTNRRVTYNAPTAGAPATPSGSVLDQRGFFQNLLLGYGARPQQNTRDTTRYVVGVRGERDQLGPIQNFSWELGYTYGEVEDSNLEIGALDAERYAFAADAVVDTNGEVNGQRGQIVCRVQLLNARGNPIPINADIVGNRPVRRNYAANDPAITGCRPFNVFGTDTVSDEVRSYITSFISRGFRTEQEDVLAFASGELWDFWGAGRLGVAIGAEYRKETFAGVIGGPDNRADRVMFNNVYTATPESSYDVSELFGEVRVPLLTDRPLVDNLEVSGAYRLSEYSNIGRSETWSTQGSWRLTPDLMFRGTYGKAVRAPTLNELFRGPAQTFVQVTDTCSRPIIDGTADPVVRANRNSNCLALGIPATYVDPNPTTTNSGVNGPNPNLQPEESKSWTLSAVMTPRFAPGLSVVLDYYDIKIENAINTVQVNQLAQLCTDQAAPNQAACALLTRDATTFEINFFLQGFFNYAALKTRGLDFNAKYTTDLQDVIGRDWGRVDLSLRGNYLIRNQSFADPLNPAAVDNLDGILNFPRMRVLFGTTYSKGPLGLTWEVDWQSSQEIFDSVVLINDPDNRSPDLLTTGGYATHDFTVRYDLGDHVRLRAGVINAFDNDPPVVARGLNIPNALVGLGGDTDQYDIFGRRFFVGVTYRR